MSVNYNLYVIYAISFTDLFAVGLMFPLLQPHLRSLGASHFTIGLIGSTYSAVQVLAGPLIGSWSDLRGRKFVLLSTLTVCAFTYLLLGFVSSFLVIFLLRFISGFVKNTQTLCKAMIADILPKGDHVKAYGTSAGLGSLGFVIGPVIGGHMSQMENGFQYVCILTSLLFLNNILLSMFIPNTKGSQITENLSTFQLLKGMHKELKKATLELVKIDWSTYWDAFLIRFLFGVSASIFFTNQSLYLKETHHLSQIYIGYTISFLGIIGVITSFLLGWITKKFYQEDNNCLKRIHHSFILFSICFFGFYLSPDLYVFYLFLIPFAISNTVLRIISMEMMLMKSKKDEKGSLSGASNSIMSISRFVTPLTSGVIADLYGAETAMFSAFIPAFAGTLISVKLLRAAQKRGKIE